MNVVRVNFSHGDHATHAANIAKVRAAAAERNRMVPIVADLQGPKVRTGKLEGGVPLELRAGDTLLLTPEQVIGTPQRVSIDYASLSTDVKPGDTVLLADGAVELCVVRVQGLDVLTEVRNDGQLGERKGVNVPGADMRLPSITEEDKEDLKFALSHNVSTSRNRSCAAPRTCTWRKNFIEWCGGRRT